MKLPKRSNLYYGWRADTPDIRDYSFHLTLSRTALGIRELPPASIDMRASMPPIYDQGEIGSCTANAIAAAMEHARITNKLADVRPSRLQIYYGEREIEGTVKSDAGAEIRDGIKVVANVGAAPEALWTYKKANLFKKPSSAVMKQAAKHKVATYARVDQNTDAIMQALAQGFPVIFGFSVYSFFESDEMASSGILKMPDTKREQLMGGHAVLMVGYKKVGNDLYWIVRNSWGAEWGQQGHFLMPAQYATNTDLASDFWVIKTCA